MALVDHQHLYLLKVQRPGSNTFSMWLTNLHASQFYAAIVAGWLASKGLSPVPDVMVDELDQLDEGWATFSDDGTMMERDEFVQMFCDHSMFTYEATFPW